MDHQNKQISNATASGETKFLDIEMATIHQDKGEDTHKPLQQDPAAVGEKLEDRLTMEQEKTKGFKAGHLRELASGKEDSSPILEQVPDDVHHNDERIPPEVLPAPNYDPPRHPTTADIEKVIGNVSAGKHESHICLNGLIQLLCCG